MAKFVTLHAILQKLVEAAKAKPETAGKLVTFILKNEKKIKPLVKSSAGAAGQVIAATEVLKKVNNITGDNMNKVDKAVFNSASKAISILQDATSIVNLVTGGKTKSGAGKFFRQAEKFVNPGQIVLEQMKGKINMANKIREKLFGPNDTKWYGHYPELNEAMIGPNFYNIVGSPVKSVPDVSRQYSVPLGLSMDLMLSIPTKVTNITFSNTGQMEAETNVFDNAINKIYASIRRANTGAINYSPKDLKLFILNFRSVLAGYVMFGRVYGTINKYKLLNRAVPSLFYNMIGIADKANQRSFENNAANLFNKLTQWRIRLNSICPIYLDLFKRTEWLFTGYWKDDDSSKAQYFAFNGKILPKYDYKQGATNDQNGIANKVMANGFNNQYESCVAEFENDIDNLANYPTNVIIAGDMLRAFKDAGLRQYLLPKYAMGYEAPEAYDLEALTIIQNSSTIPWDYTTGNARLWSSGNDKFFTMIMKDITASSDAFYDLGNFERTKFINAYKGVRSVINDNKVTLALTRFTTPYGDAPFGPNHVAYAAVVGTEVVLNRHFYYNNAWGDLQTLKYYDYIVLDATEDPTPYFTMQYCWAGIDWCPMLKPTVRLNVSESSATLKCLPLFDWELYATVNDDQLDNYNNIVTMNLLFTPDVFRPNKVEVMITNKTDKSGKSEKKDK